MNEHERARWEELDRIRDEMIAELDLDLNPSQERTIQSIIVHAFRSKAGHHLQYLDEHEVKEFTVEPLSETSRRILTVTIELGRKNDEGTLGALLFRSRAHLFVGIRGGVSWYRPSQSGGGSVRERGRRNLYRAFFSDSTYQTPADYTRTQIRMGKTNEEIREALRQRFPDYGAWKIAPATYRRELRAKGEDV